MPDIGKQTFDQNIAAQASKRLSYIESLAKANARIEDLACILSEALEGCFYEPIAFPTGRAIYRAVRVSSRPSNVDRLSYPPAHLVNSIGRVNLPGQSVFYGALSGSSACLYECHAGIGEVFVVSKWRTTAPMHLFHFGYLAKQVTDSRTKLLNVNNWLSISPANPKDAIIRSWEAKIFTMEGSNFVYKLSNTISRLIRKPVAGPDITISGILYPSVAMGYLQDNVALQKSFVDRYLEFEDCEMHRIERIRPNSSVVPGEETFTVKKLAHCDQIGEDGTLRWARNWNVTN